jgi:hypothetical protein
MFNRLQRESCNAKQKSSWIREALNTYLEEDHRQEFARAGLADKFDQK